MPRKQIPIITPVGPYPTLPVSALALNIAFTTADSVNFDQFNFTGRELIIIRNSTAGALTFTLESIADDLKRTGDITTYTLGVGLFAAFWAGSLPGWNNAGQFFFRSSASTMDYAVIRIPG
jgi:hypothetical protein